jgi:mannitol-1-phosphate 5-dehydrogenase
MTIADNLYRRVPIIMEILIWGAGKIGRGFLAQLFGQAGYQILFVDQDKELIQKLRAAGSYPLLMVAADGKEQVIPIGGFQALHTGEAEPLTETVARSSLIAVAVPAAAFAEVARGLAPGIARRAREAPDSPLDIILCANVLHPGPHFRTLLAKEMPAEGADYLRQKVGVVESLVIRMAPDPPPELLARDPLLVLTDDYPELPLDRAAFCGPFPAVPGLRPVENMRAEETRKLYTYNLAHAVLAYLGAMRGYQWVIDCVRDPELHQTVAGALMEAGEALLREFGFEREEMAVWNETALRRMENPALQDRVERIGADPERKLGREDRLTGPALLARKHGIRPVNIVRGIAAALCFRNPADPAAERVRQVVEDAGPEAALRRFCGLHEETDLVEMIVNSYHGLRLGREAYRLGIEYERTYHGCGQCTLAAILDTLGRREDTLFQAATAFAGGIGLCGDGACGGYIGGVLAMGLYIGRRRDHFGEDREEKARTAEMARRLHERFIATYGSVICNDIHMVLFGRTFDLTDPDDRRAFDEAGGHSDKCPLVVGRAAQWTVEILCEELGLA